MPDWTGREEEYSKVPDPHPKRKRTLKKLEQLKEFVRSNNLGGDYLEALDAAIYAVWCSKD